MLTKAGRWNGSTELRDGKALTVEGHNCKEGLWENPTLRASSSLHQVRQVAGVEAVQNAAWEVARIQSSTTPGAFANTPSWLVKKSQC